jgi:hypothetical protein
MSRSLKLHARPFFNERGDEYRHCHLSLYTFRSHCASNTHPALFPILDACMLMYTKKFTAMIFVLSYIECAPFCILYFVCVSERAGCVYCSPQTQPTLKEYLSLSASSAGGI